MPRQIAVSRAVRVNNGNYEHTDIFHSDSREVDELDDEVAIRREMRELVHAALVEDVLEHYRNRGRADMDRAAIRRRHGL